MHAMSVPGTRREGAWRSRPSVDSGSMTLSLRPRSQRAQAPSAPPVHPAEGPLICAERGGRVPRCPSVSCAGTGCGGWRPPRPPLRRPRCRSSCPPIDSRGWPFGPSRASPGGRSKVFWEGVVLVLLPGGAGLGYPPSSFGSRLTIPEGQYRIRLTAAGRRSRCRERHELWGGRAEQN